MNITTKYDIGQMIRFNKVIPATTSKGKDTIEEHVGIVEKILVSPGVSYLMKSSYQNWVKEENIISVLVDKQS